MGKKFIVSAIIASALSSPLRSDTQGMASVSSEAYPEQILAAPAGDYMNTKVVTEAPKELSLKPGDYLFWIPYAIYGYTCSKSAKLEEKKQYDIKFFPDVKESTCTIEVKEMK